MDKVEAIEAMARAIGQFMCASERHKGEHCLAATAALTAAEPFFADVREQWLPIADAPKDGTRAVLYFPQHADDSFDGLDYRYRLAIYREGDWRDQGTNHDSFEGVDLSYGDRATLYNPLPDPPVLDEVVGTGEEQGNEWDDLR